MRTPSEALQTLRDLPCGARLLGAVVGVPGAYLVGGAVRDLLLEREPSELDVVVAGDLAPVVAGLGEIAAEHDRFGTVAVRDGDCAFDVVRARTETYAQPGALPEVRPGTIAEDLARRDFTVNALALNFDGELLNAPGALEDLQARALRVQHPRSFLDDPTRLWRLVRYAVRLGFAPEPETDRLAVAAVREGALETVSGDRLGAELRLALGEPDPMAVLHAAQNLGLVEGLRLEPALVAAALDLLPHEGRRDLTLLGAVVPHRAWPSRFGFTAHEEHVLSRCAELEPVVPGAPSEVAERLRREPIEAIAVAGARGDRATALRWFDLWRHVRLEIDGRDLLHAGVPEGPQIGARLRRTLAARLDGRIEPGRDAELAEALRE